MTEFWETNFKDKRAMWGFQSVDCVTDTVNLFSKHGLKKILIPGYGYGRNAKVFTNNGFDVTGIEISQTAINLAKEHYGNEIKVQHGSVSDMPFDNEVYDGIYCYALIHLLNEEGRTKLIQDCDNQLRKGGYMVFVAISKTTPAYGQGKEVSKDTFLTPHGVTIFYYDEDSIKREFSKYEILETKEIQESSQTFWQVTCRKG